MILKSIPLIALLGVTALRGDIAPTKFTGTNVFPMANAEVRMSNAAVRIVWGQPCSLEARFSLVNESGKELDLEVGFPVGAYHVDATGSVVEYDDKQKPAKDITESVGPEVIVISVNGDRVAPFRRLTSERIAEIRNRYASWYFAKVHLRAGANDVRVNTKLSPSQVYYAPYKRSLSYCISTGGRWKGPIGKETVEIVFPKSAPSSFVTHIKPDAGRIDGESIRWTFVEIEPGRRGIRVFLRKSSPKRNII